MPSGFRRSRALRHLRVLLVALAGVAALVAGVGFGTPALRPIGVVLVLIALTAGVGVELAARHLRLSRSFDQDVITAGEPITATLRLSGWAARSGLLNLLEWDANMAGPAGSTVSGVTTTRRGGEIYHRVVLTAIPRGEHQCGAPWVRIGDPFGLVRVRRALRSNGSVLAMARTVPVSLPFWEGALRRMGDAVGRARGRVELGGIRDYEPGDPLSLIHWTQTARRGRLQTKELHGESGRGRRMVVVLDATTPGTEEDFEVAVSAAASLVAGCVARGAAVGLTCAADPPINLPVTSPVDVMERSLARVVANGVEPLSAVAHRVTGSSDAPDLIVLVTAGDDRQLPSAAAAARAGGTTIAAVLVGAARDNTPHLRRAGAIVTEAADFDELTRALDLVGAHA